MPEVERLQDIIAGYERLHVAHERVMGRWRALACGHEPGDPYTTLTRARELELLRMRVAELEAATDERYDEELRGQPVRERLAQEQE